MVNRIETVYPSGPNKGFSSRFCVRSQVRHETSEESRRTYRSKRCEYNNKNKVNSPDIQSNNKYQASSKKFRQMIDCIQFGQKPNVRKFVQNLKKISLSLLKVTSVCALRRH